MSNEKVLQSILNSVPRLLTQKPNEDGSVTVAKLDPSQYEFKVNDTGRRMKIYIKLNKDETTALKNYTQMIKPPEITEADFYKLLFFRGFQTIQEEVMEAWKREQDTSKIEDKLAEIEGNENIEVIEDAEATE